MIFIDKYVLMYAYVPEHFLSRKDLSYLDKLVYIRIVGFCKCDKFNNTCFASNSYFAELFGVKTKAISVTIGKLKRLNLIKVEHQKDEDKLTKRVITLTSNVWSEISNKSSLSEEEVVPQMKEHNNKTNNKKILNNIISYDTDGVMLWNGKRCESTKASEEEIKEMEEILSEFK